MIAHDLFSECMSLTIMHGDQTTYQPWKMHTTTVLHGENNLTMILQLPGPWTCPHQCGTSLSKFYVGGIHTLSPSCQHKKIG